MSKQSVISTLGYSGLIPFLVTVYLLSTGITLPGWNVELIFLSYSTVILAFLGGALWGQSISLDDSPFVRMLLITSNLIALSVWLSLNIGVFDQRTAIAVLSVGYSLTLFLELHLSRSLASLAGTHQNRHYLNLRIILTTVVVLLHLVAFAFSP